MARPHLTPHVSRDSTTPGKYGTGPCSNQRPHQESRLIDSSWEPPVPFSTKHSCNLAIPTRVPSSRTPSRASSAPSAKLKMTSPFTRIPSTTGMQRPVRLQISGTLRWSTEVKPTKTCPLNHSCSPTETSMRSSPLTILRTPPTPGQTVPHFTRPIKRLLIKHRPTTFR